MKKKKKKKKEEEMKKKKKKEEEEEEEEKKKNGTSVCLTELAGFKQSSGSSSLLPHFDESPGILAGITGVSRYFGTLCGGSMAKVDDSVYESLTRQHGVRIACNAGVEECVLVVGNTPSKKIILSNVPPFLKNDTIAKELFRYGKLVTPIRKIHMGSKAPESQNSKIASFRRRVYMVLNNGVEELDLAMKFGVDGFDYTVCVSTDSGMKCFNCGEAGHLVRACPEKVKMDGATDRQAGQTRTKVCSGDTEGDGPSVSGSPAAESVPADPPAAKPVAAASSMLDPVMTVSPAVETGLRGGNPGEPPLTRALEIEVVELQGLVESTGNRGHIEALRKKIHVLDELLDTTVQGVLVRSRFKSATEMDAPSKFFFSLEKKNGQKRFIHALRTDSGELVTDPTEIRKQTVSFYSKLYRSELAAVQEVEEDFVRNLPKMTKESAKELDRELTLKELEVALNSMQNGWSPDIDGLFQGFLLVELSGPDFAHSNDVAARIGVKSVRVVAQLLQGWRSALTSEEHLQLRDYCAGVVSPVEGPLKSRTVVSARESRYPAERKDGEEDFGKTNLRCCQSC
ncbi:hypothetical protein QTP70_009669 [Hemibagrus guttatus]|uniref:CCHC-type domain-containing protein n=1 Tax=Hemibagrus guttatus TaxID=175788 RepID=A0AAE0V3S9_9TELE|nr:hypothetical protein QTP70_009669 [Hemibagrus guttatus]